MIQKLLDYVIKKNASDLYISSGSKTFVRIDGELEVIPNVNLAQSEIMRLLHSIMSDKQIKEYREHLEIDFSIDGNDKDYRFRINAFTNLHGPAAVFRTIPTNSMTLDEIEAPLTVRNLCQLSKGLVLVVGPTGSGKSTTLAAMLNYMNTKYNRHIITIEDPVEFTFKTDKCLINQREVGADTESFAKALRSSLRESPDVIMVGEMRDAETTRLALTAAETGHLVLATMHTMSASQTINRIIDTFPANDKSIARSMLSSSLQGIISQRLIKKKDSGRCAALEIMLANSSVRNLIREDKVPQINSIIEIGQRQGMITMKHSVIELVEKGYISKEVARELLLSFGH